MLTWTVEIWRNGGWRRLHKTKYKVFANAARKVNEMQKLLPLEMIRARQHPPAVVVGNEHVLKGTNEKAPLQGEMMYGEMKGNFETPTKRRRGYCTVMVEDLMYSELNEFMGGGIEEYEESAQWHHGEILVSWNADDTGFSSYREDQYGRRISQDVTFKPQYRTNRV